MMEEIFLKWKIDPQQPLGLIFDVDETLFNNEKDIFQAYEFLLSSRRIGITKEENFSGQDLFDIIGRVKKKYGIIDSVDQLVLERREKYIELLRRTDSPVKEGVREVFRFLNENKDILNIRLVYATSSEKAFTDIILKRVFHCCGLESHIENPDSFFYHNERGECAATCWKPGEKKKPDPQVYLKTLEKIGLPTSQCMAFEDSKSGFLSAQASGLNTVVVPSPWSVDCFKGHEYNRVSDQGVLKLKTLTDFVPFLQMLKKHKMISI